MRRLLPLALATVTVLVVGLGLTASAWGPPAVGEPSIGVSVRCAPYGSSFTVTAGSFLPGSRVDISNPAGHYTGPPHPWGAIAPVTAVADDSGVVTARLRVAAAPGGTAATYRAATIWADGPGKADGQRATVFTGVVVASRAACRYLDRPAPPKHR